MKKAPRSLGNAKKIFARRLPALTPQKTSNGNMTNAARKPSF